MRIWYPPENSYRTFVKSTSKTKSRKKKFRFPFVVFFAEMRPVWLSTRVDWKIGYVVRECQFGIHWEHEYRLLHTALSKIIGEACFFHIHCARQCQFFRVDERWNSHLQTVFISEGFRNIGKPNHGKKIEKSVPILRGRKKALLLRFRITYGITLFPLSCRTRSASLFFAIPNYIWNDKW